MNVIYTIFYILFMPIFCHFNAAWVVFFMTCADFQSRADFEENTKKTVEKKSCRDEYVDTYGSQFQNRDSSGVQSLNKKARKKSRSSGQAFTMKTLSEREFSIDWSKPMTRLWQLFLDSESKMYCIRWRKHRILRWIHRPHESGEDVIFQKPFRFKSQFQ